MARAGFAFRLLKPSAVAAFVAFLAACGSGGGGAGGEVPSAQWARSYGPQMTMRGTAWPTTDGGYVLVGNTDRGVTAEIDAWILNLDAAGEVVWRKTYDAGDVDIFTDVQPAADGGFLVVGQSGTTGPGGFFLKLDSGGNVLWAKTGTGVSSPIVRSSPDGGYVVVGETPSPRGLHIPDGAILKLDASGEIVWQKTYVPGAAVTRGWTRFSAVHPTDDGGYIVAGRTESLPGRRALVLRLDAFGNIAWQKTFPNAAYCGDWGSCDVRPTRDGGFVLLGVTAVPSLEFPFALAWLAKFDAGGNVVWQKGYGSREGDTFAGAVQPTLDGGYVLALDAYSSASSFGEDAVLMKVDATGNIQWQRAYGGEGAESFRSIQPSPDGGYVVAGTRYPGSRLALSPANAWLLRLDATGQIAGCTIMRQANLTSIDTGAVAEDVQGVASRSNVTPISSTLALSSASTIEDEQCYAPRSP